MCVRVCVCACVQDEMYAYVCMFLFFVHGCAYVVVSKMSMCGNVSVCE